MRALTGIAAALALMSLACGPAAESPESAVVVDTVVTTDGVPIVYDVRGTGEPTLVFVHCWACDRTFWKGQLDTLATAHRVVAMDLPGHGESGKTRTSWTLAGLAADVQTVADALELDRMVLIGHSMGAPLSLLAAARMPGRVEGVVCVDALQNADFVFPRELSEQMMAAFHADFPGQMGRMVDMMFPPAADTAIKRWVLDKGVAADTAAVLSIIADYPSYDEKTALAAAGVPVRCINAVPSSLMSLPTNVEANRKYADFDAVLMEGVGHYLHLERPAEFNALLIQTLERLAAARDTTNG
jgi:pimeloyl-ACP methyl ester carboxylesterase